MKKAVFFDMNETLLNLSVLTKSFDHYFDDKFVMKYWFTKLLHTSSVMGAMDEYKNFGQHKIRTIAVSNSSSEMIKEQLTQAGILDLFDAWYSVDAVKKYKTFSFQAMPKIKRPEKCTISTP